MSVTPALSGIAGRAYNGIMPAACTCRRTCRCRECGTSRCTPSPAEIRQACESIRAGWTATEQTARIADGETARIVSERYSVPLVNLDAVDDALWRE